MPKQSKQTKKDSAESKDIKEAPLKGKARAEQSAQALSIEELSAIVQQDHQRLEEMHKYLKHVRLLSGIRLMITVLLIVAPLVFAFFALPPLLRKIEGTLMESGVLSETGEFSPDQLFQQMVGNQVEGQLMQGFEQFGQFDGTLDQPPADFDTWTPEEQERWVKEQFDNK